METNGKLSVILKADKRPMVPADLGLNPPYEGLPIPLICDGKVLKDNMALAKKDLNWLEQTLAKNHKVGVAGVLYATLDPQNQLHVYKKGENKKAP